MERVTGIGGVFFRARDPEALTAWYAEHVGVPVQPDGYVVFTDSRNACVWSAFKEDTVDVPLYEEEVRVSKRPVLEEEVVVRTVAHSVEREGSAMLRHEEAEVEDTRRSSGLSASADYEYSNTDPDTRRS